MNSSEAPRPMSLGEILDRTVQIYRGRFLVYLGIAIIPTGVLLIFGGAILLGFAWFGAGTRNGALVFNMPATSFLAMLFVAGVSLVALPVMLGVSSLSTGAMNHAVAGALAGRRPTIRGSFVEAWRRGWRYLWLYILRALIVWGAPLIVWVAVVTGLTVVMASTGRVAGGQAAGALVGLMTLAGVMALAGYALWMLLCVGLAFPGSVVEKIGAWKALRRSFGLSKGTRGRIFVLYLLGYALGSIASMVAFAILVIVFLLFPTLNSPQNSQALGMVMLFLFYGMSFAMQAFTKPVYAIALMLFYYDQRIRNEGFDIEWMMERAGLMPDGAVASGESLVAAGVGSLAGTNGEFPPAPGNDSLAVHVEIESVREGEIFVTSPLHLTDEQVEATQALQPESERQS